MYKKILTILSIFTFIFTSAIASENLIENLKKGSNIIFIRHALAPGSGDPKNFKLKDCSTQRNLDHEGIEQSKRIGLFFSKNKIPIDMVLSSEWCRCKDTSKYAFKEYKTFNALNSFFSTKFQKNKERQVSDLLKYLQNWQSKKNLVLITHYVVILEITNLAVSSGEMIIMDKNLNLLGSLIKY